MVKLFPGKFWESIIKVSLKNNTNESMLHQSSFFSIEAPSDAEGPQTKSGAPWVLKILNNFFLVFLSQCRVGVVIRNHNY